MRQRKGLRAVAGAILASAFVSATTVVAAQDDESSEYAIEFGELNNSGVDAQGTMTLDGTTLTVNITANGVSPDAAPHAQHIHGNPGETNTCPQADADTDNSGITTVAEGAIFYGGILTSLTTDGDTTPTSALAVDRFPTGTDGTYTYERTFEISQDIADNLDTYHVVIHGIDLDDSGAYDGDTPSSIEPTLPLEATAPATCGTITLTTTDDNGDTDTDGDNTDDGENTDGGDNGGDDGETDDGENTDEGETNNTTFEVTVENLTDSQPFSPPVVVTHNDSVKLVEVGSNISTEVAAIAQGGDPMPAAELVAGLDAVTDSLVLDGPIAPLNSQSDRPTTRTFSIDGAEGDVFSIASMLICTNDGLWGADSIALPAAGESVEILSKGYDGGVEENTELSADIVDPCSALGPVVIGGDPDGNVDDGEVLTDPQQALALHPGVDGTVGDLLAAHGWTGDVARITITAPAANGDTEDGDTEDGDTEDGDNGDNTDGYSVNATADTADASPGDGDCADEDGQCSLRAAIQEANASGGGTIDLMAGTFNLAIEGASEDDGATGDLDISSNIVINTEYAAISANGLDRIFDIAAGGSLEIHNMVLTDGKAPEGESGGAIRNAGTLTGSDLRISGNAATDGEGASGGGLFNSGTMEISRSIISKNSALRAGGGVEADGGETTLESVTLTGNATGDMPGNGGGLHLTGAGTVNVVESSVSGNFASAEGGGLWNSGSGTMTVTDSVVNGNEAAGDEDGSGGGGLYNDGGTLTVTDSQVTGNSASGENGSGSGILNNGGQLDVSGSDVEGQEDSSDSADDADDADDSDDSADETDDSDEDETDSDDGADDSDDSAENSDDSDDSADDGDDSDDSADDADDSDDSADDSADSDSAGGVV